MKTTLTGVLVLMLVASVAYAKHPNNGQGEDHPVPTIVAFDTMYGVDGPFVGDEQPIRGIPGDELPWEIESAHGRLDADGHLVIRVRGLVFANDPSVPKDIIGTNDETEFRAVVSCLTEHSDTVRTANVFTRGFPADTAGNSDIDTTIRLPSPCLAPVVLVLAGSENKWFAVNGFESD